MNSGTFCLREGRSAAGFPIVFLLLLALLQTSSGDAAQSTGGGIGWVRKPGFTEDGAESCLPCHFSEKMQAVAASPHGNSANPATPYSKKGCESCHGPGSFHVSRAHGGKGLPKLISFGRGPGNSSRQEQLRACLACHEDKNSGSTQIGFTNSVHDLGSISCSRCHQAHAESQPIGQARQQAIICFACHRKMKQDHPLIGRRPINFDKLPCGKCHRIHPAP